MAKTYKERERTQYLKQLVLLPLHKPKPNKAKTYT